MEQITLRKRNGTNIKLFNKEPFRTVKAATQSKSMMGVDTVTLSVFTREILSFDKGDYITVNGEYYYIRTKVNRELTSDGYFKYDAVFYGVLYDLMKTPYRNMDASGNSTTSTFDLVYTLKEYIRVLINNTNKDYPGWWVFDETGCPDKDPIAFQFSCNNCLEVLQQICQKFKVDFRITQNNNVRTIQIGHFGEKITPPDGSSKFEWGRGKGLYSLKENKVDDKAIKTRIWVEGGTSNLPTGYRDYAMRLQLPLRRKNKNAHTLSDGTVIAANSEYIGITSENARYIEDTALSNALGVDADSKLYDDIVPTRTGEVTSIDSNDVLSFYDTSMDFDINNHLVNNVSAKITFITGSLAGQTLEISKYDATNKKFTLIPYTDSRGLTIPTADSTAFRIAVGNKYKLTDIIMPQSIIDDAEENLWYAGYDDLNQLKQARVQYSLELNRMRILEVMPTDSDTVLFKPGDYVPVKDTRFGVDKNIRIQKVERNLLLRHDYHLTIADTATIDVITQTVVDTQNHEVIIINNGLRDLTKMRRGWRTTEELRNMVFDTDGYFDVSNFKANTIDTNMLTVGSKSQQFVLSGVVIEPNYGGNANRIVISAGSLIHLTINQNSARLWNMSRSDVTMGNTTGYYLYAKCPKSGDNGSWLVTQTQYKADPSGNYYYFLVGIIGTAYDATGGHTPYRDFTTTYGFTRINGNTITTGKIVTSDGYNYLDLDGAKFRIGDANSSFDFNVTKQNQITLHNVKLMSGTAADPVYSDIGVYRGVYDPNYIYYNGDEVAYTHNGVTATYRYINPTPSKGKAPTDSAYWSVVAKGKDAENVGTNILVDTAEFKDDSKWFWLNGYNNGTYNGRVSRYVSPGGSSQSSESFERIAEQLIIDTGSTRKLETSSWYTLSVYMKGVGNAGLFMLQAGNYLENTFYLDGDEKTISMSAQGDLGGSFSLSQEWECHTLTFKTKSTFSRIYNLYASTRLLSLNGYVYIAMMKLEAGREATAYIPNEVDLVGAKGINADFYEHRYAVNGSPTSPPSLTNTDRNPSGWSTYLTNPGTLEYLWRITALINGETNELKSSWTTPVRQNPIDAVELGENLVDNSEVEEDYEVVESWNTTDSTTTPPQSPQFILTQKRMCRIPANGTKYSAQARITLTGVRAKSGGASVLLYVNGTKGYPTIVEKVNIPYTSYTANYFFDLKTENATFNHNGGTMYKQIYLRLNNFYAGGVVSVSRVKLEIGARCSAWSRSEADKSGPAVLFQGVYDPSTVYHGNSRRIDCVKYDGIYYAARYDAGEFSGKVPTDTDYWNTFGAQFESVATSLLLAEFAYIENLGVRNLLTAEGGRRVQISADENAMSIYDDDDKLAIAITGEQFSDSDLFGGSEIPISMSSTNLSMQTGNALHPNITYNNTATNATFTTTKAGVVKGSVTLRLNSYGSYSIASGKPSQMFSARVSVYLDGVYLGYLDIGDMPESKNKTISFEKAISKGSHKLQTKIQVVNPNYVDQSSYSVTAISEWSNVKAEFDVRMSRYFANGNAVGCGSSQFFETIMENNKLMHKVRSGNAGLEINDGSMKLLIGGVWYTASVQTIDNKKHLILT